MAFLAARSSGVSPKRLQMPCTTGSRVAARALAAGTRKPSIILTKNMPQMTRPTDDALKRDRMPRAMRRSSPMSCMTAATIKANKHSQITWSVKPANMTAIGGLPLVQGRALVISSMVGMEMPVMPAGMASLTHMMLAQTTMPRTAIPSGVRPGNGLSIPQKRMKASHARINPAKALQGVLPDLRTFSQR